jgi:hypothetical protein
MRTRKKGIAKRVDEDLTWRHLERVAALNGAVLSRVAADHQAASVVARKVQ